MPSLILVRHGQASFGAESYDVLSETGHEQARLVATELHRRGVRPGRLISGSQKRQVDTAAPIADAFGLEPLVDARWNEYSADDVLEHHATTKVRLETTGPAAPVMTSRDFQAVLEAALSGWIEAGRASPARERWPAFLARVAAALTSALEGLEPGSAAVVTTSGGPVAATCADLMGGDATLMLAFNRAAINGAITTVTSGRGGRTLVSFNEHGHLLRSEPSLLTYR